jgi:hypothetical protein
MSLAHNRRQEALMIAHDWRHAFTRIQIEYIEMPDLKLTIAQIRRLCDLPADLCSTAVQALEQSGFLRQSVDGRFVRRALGRAGREISDADLDAIAGPSIEPPGVQAAHQ